MDSLPPISSVRCHRQPYASRYVPDAAQMEVLSGIRH
jgi:hypothetical protein